MEVLSTCLDIRPSCAAAGMMRYMQWCFVTVYLVLASLPDSTLKEGHDSHNILTNGPGLSQ